MIINIREAHDSRFLTQTINTLIYIPLTLLFYAYGVKSDREIIEYCNPEKSE